MATIRKRGKHWQAQIRKRGYPSISKTFNSHSAANTWAKTVESELERGIYLDRTLSEHTLVRDILQRYESEVIPALRGAYSEKYRLRLLDDYFGNYSLAALNTSHLATYRENRLLSVSAHSVKRELGLLNRVLKRAHFEWNIPLPFGVPKVKNPKTPSGRERRLNHNEEERLLSALDNNPIMCSVILFALETAMRRGEISNIRWSHVNLKDKTLTIPITKTDVSRTIPLSVKARNILTSLPIRIDGYIFGLRPDSISQAFHRACIKAEIEDLRFHDLRHEATSRLFEKGLNTMEVSCITGHKTLEMLKRYTHLKAQNLVKKIQ